MFQNSSSSQERHHHHHQNAPKSGGTYQSEHHRRVSREEAMAIKAEVDYQRLNKSFTDVTFIVGPPQHSKKYVGHRVLLAMTSPVFETMFYGDMADKNKYIRIPDVAPIGFENLLRYAYTDSLNLGSVEDAMLTAYAAKKYLLPQLLRECLTYIEHNIGPSTACVVFEFAHVLNSQQLVLQAMNLIDRQTNSVIANKSFNHVQATTIEFVANRKYLSLSSEYSLFNAIIGWSLSEARRRSLSSDDWQNIRTILIGDPILSAIRFLTMTQEEFARAVAKTSSMVATETTSKDLQQQVNGGDLTELAGSEGTGSGGGGAGAGSTAEEFGAGSGSGVSYRVDVNDSNSLLTEAEQRAIFLNLALNNLAKLPPTINPSTQNRQPPPEHFTLKRFRSSTGASNLVTATTTTRSIKSISNASSYANRTPKFECHLKFITKTTGSSPQQPPLVAGSVSPMAASQSGSAANDSLVGQEANLSSTSTGGLLDGSTLLMDTIDESLNISIARDKDCLVRLKRPILIRMGNINELTLTFQTYALDEDIIALRTPKLRSANFSEQTDGENVSWLFFKTSNIEFSELHYYY